MSDSGNLPNELKPLPSGSKLLIASTMLAALAVVIAIFALLVSLGVLLPRSQPDFEEGSKSFILANPGVPVE